jgi:hypothetical protein
MPDFEFPVDKAKIVINNLTYKRSINK